MPINRYFVSDFVSIQRQSFFKLLETGLIEEFSKRNPITSDKKDLSFVFYPEHYVLTKPEYTPQEAIFKNKSYTSKLYVPAQLIDKKQQTISLKWVYIGNIPLMTKRGHFILNGAARVIVNQILRSPGIYYQQKIYENTTEKMQKTKADDSFKRYFADLICMRGTWLRIEMDKEKNIWAQMKKGPKIPIYWFLLAMGVSEKIIFKSITDSQRLIGNLETSKVTEDNQIEIDLSFDDSDNSETNRKIKQKKKQKYPYLKNPPEAWQSIYALLKKSKTKEKNLAELGRKWLYNRFMNPRSYDLSRQGRLAFNRKLGLNISETQTTLTGLDVLYATDYLIQVEKGLYKTDDIDHLKNRRVRTSGELIQIQVGVGLVRLEKSIRDALNQTSLSRTNAFQMSSPKAPSAYKRSTDSTEGSANGTAAADSKQKNSALTYLSPQSFVNNKAFNSAMREFFGTSPLSQFMDQINPLAELTHKRRLSSMGPGGVTRDTATLAIRGIHPTHYGRICPIETPEGKNTGLVNSMTTYARVNANGIIESPFYKVYKGQVQKNTGMYYFSAEQEEKIQLAAADLSVSAINFLPKSLIPVRIAEDFTKIYRSKVQFIGVSPLQMISIAASLIPFLEHDDANRALMGSNMQRQAVPLVRPERPIVGTGLEARAVSDSGHALQSKFSGLVTYVSANKIVVYSLVSN